MKRWTLIAAGSLLALVVAFLAGRFSAAPGKKTEAVADTSRAASSGTAEEKKNEGTTQVVARKITERKRPPTPAPPGCPPCAPIDEKDTEEQIGTSTFDLGTLKLGWSDSVEATHSASRTSETNRPDWRLQLDVGWSKVTPRPDVYGLELSRRMVGTVWAGAWARTDKTAGLSLALEF